MTSLRQIESNRHNALKSTGPTTSAGKDRSRRNAIRHGMCAETVITAVEDMDDYRAFEASVTADYDATTAVERELVLRLASLLWRLRRATAIETGLLETHAERVMGSGAVSDRSPAEAGESLGSTPDPSQPSNSEISQCFSSLCGPDDAAFDRVGRYETALWRQLRQTLFTLQLLRWEKDTTLRPRARNAWWRSPP
jgi:hypothetical protein